MEVISDHVIRKFSMNLQFFYRISVVLLLSDIYCSSGLITNWLYESPEARSVDVGNLVTWPRNLAAIGFAT